MKRQKKSIWRKDISVLAENWKGSRNKKTGKSGRFFKNVRRVTNAREVAQLTEALKQKVQAKIQRIRR